MYLIGGANLSLRRIIIMAFLSSYKATPHRSLLWVDCQKPRLHAFGIIIMFRFTRRTLAADNILVD